MFKLKLINVSIYVKVMKLRHGKLFVDVTNVPPQNQWFPTPPTPFCFFMGNEVFKSQP